MVHAVEEGGSMLATTFEMPRRPRLDKNDHPIFLILINWGETITRNKEAVKPSTTREVDFSLKMNDIG